MYRREVPKLNKEKFPAWQSLMKLHIFGIGDTAWNSVENAYVDPTRTLTIEQLKETKEHNQEMLEIGFALTQSKFEDVKDFLNANLMWTTLAKIYG